MAVTAIAWSMFISFVVEVEQASPFMSPCQICPSDGCKKLTPLSPNIALCHMTAFQCGFCCISEMLAGYFSLSLYMLCDL